MLFNCIYNVDIVPNTFTTNASSFYSNFKNADSYYFVDVTQWIWPRFVKMLKSL